MADIKYESNLNLKMAEVTPQTEASAENMNQWFGQPLGNDAANDEKASQTSTIVQEQLEPLNQQIAQIKQTNTQQDTNISEIQKTVGTLSEGQTQLQGNFGTLNQTVSSLDTTVGELSQAQTQLRQDLSGKVDIQGGNISSTQIETLGTTTEQFPSPTAKTSASFFLGKVKKFIDDFKAWNTGVMLVGRMSNQQLNDTSRVPTSALVYSMQQALTKAQSDISALGTNSGKLVRNSAKNAKGITLLAGQSTILDLEFPFSNKYISAMLSTGAVNSLVSYPNLSAFITFKTVIGDSENSISPRLELRNYGSSTINIPAETFEIIMYSER